MELIDLRRFLFVHLFRLDYDIMLGFGFGWRNHTLQLVECPGLTPSCYQLCATGCHLILQERRYPCYKLLIICLFFLNFLVISHIDAQCG